jgi:predicted XRE-type DNA-binding protein
MSKPKETDYEITEGTVFAAIKRKDADELVARSELLEEVGDLIEKSGLRQKEVAKKLGIKQSKVSMLVNGHLSEFSTETLLQYLAILGCSVEIRLKKPRRQSIFAYRGRIAVC